MFQQPTSGPTPTDHATESTTKKEENKLMYKYKSLLTNQPASSATESMSHID